MSAEEIVPERLLSATGNSGPKPIRVALAPVPRSLSKSRLNILGVRRLDAEAASSSIDETIFGLNAIELRFCGLTMPLNASGCFLAVRISSAKSTIQKTGLRACYGSVETEDAVGVSALRQKQPAAKSAFYVAQLALWEYPASGANNEVWLPDRRSGPQVITCEFSASRIGVSRLSK
jgi:hypothetical protein